MLYIMAGIFIGYNTKQILFSPRRYLDKGWRTIRLAQNILLTSTDKRGFVDAVICKI